VAAVVTYYLHLPTAAELDDDALLDLYDKISYVRQMEAEEQRKTYLQYQPQPPSAKFRPKRR